MMKIPKIKEFKEYRKHYPYNISEYKGDYEEIRCYYTNKRLTGLKKGIH